MGENSSDTSKKKISFKIFFLVADRKKGKQIDEWCFNNLNNPKKNLLQSPFWNSLGFFRILFPISVDKIIFAERIVYNLEEIVDDTFKKYFFKILFFVCLFVCFVFFLAIS